jgi:NADH-quinone oxidoreductase subunit J
MIIIHLLFYLFAVTAVTSAIIVIAARNPVRSVLALVVTFFSMAGIWMLFTAEFLSLVLLLVYVGAVMTLFLFVVMMLNINLSAERQNFSRLFPLAIIMVLLVISILVLAVGLRFNYLPTPTMPDSNYSNVTALGSVLYTEYAYPFEIAGVLLLAAIVAAINLGQRKPRERKAQDISEQLNVHPADRLRIIKMPSSPPPSNSPLPEGED